MGESTQVVSHGDVSLLKALHARLYCHPTATCADVALSNVTNVLFFFQAKGRIVVVPGNIYFFP